MSPRPSWVTWRVAFGAVLLWLADLAWEAYDWLQAAACRLQQPRRDAGRGVARLGVVVGLAMVAVVALVIGAARGVAYEPPNQAALSQPAGRDQVESTGEVLYWVVRGCAEGGGRWVQGIEDGVLVGHCTPSALPHLGVMPTPPASRFPAKARARAPEERGSARTTRDEQGRAGASAGRAGAGIDPTGGIE